MSVFLSLHYRRTFEPVCGQTRLSPCEMRSFTHAPSRINYWTNYTFFITILFFNNRHCCPFVPRNDSFQPVTDLIRFPHDSSDVRWNVFITPGRRLNFEILWALFPSTWLEGKIKRYSVSGSTLWGSVRVRIKNLEFRYGILMTEN